AGIVRGTVRRGKNVGGAVRRSATRAGWLASPSATSAKFTLPLGNSETLAFPRRTGSRPVTSRISARTRWRTVSADMRYPAVVSTAKPAAMTASRTNPRRFKPVAVVKGRIRLFRYLVPADYSIGPKGANLDGVCDPFKAERSKG